MARFMESMRAGFDSNGPRNSRFLAFALLSELEIDSAIVTHGSVQAETSRPGNNDGTRSTPGPCGRSPTGDQTRL
ncbi:MAG: hypothetical protein ACREAC_30685, partial [Blastocatellia bacterium]